MARYALRRNADQLGLSRRALLGYPEAIDLPRLDPAGAELGLGHYRTVLDVDIGTRIRLRPAPRRRSLDRSGVRPKRRPAAGRGLTRERSRGLARRVRR